LKLIGFAQISANCETQYDSSHSLIPDKSSDSIAESELPSDTMEEKVHLQHQQEEQIQIKIIIQIKIQIQIQNKVEVRKQVKVRSWVDLNLILNFILNKQYIKITPFFVNVIEM